MKTCAATEHAARTWLEAGGNESTSSHQEVSWIVHGFIFHLENSSCMHRAKREAWTIRLVACAILAAACSRGYSFIIANAPAKFSHLNPSRMRVGRELKERLARLDGTCRRAGATLPDGEVSSRATAARLRASAWSHPGSGPYQAASSTRAGDVFHRQQSCEQDVLERPSTNNDDGGPMAWTRFVYLNFIVLCL